MKRVSEFLADTQFQGASQMRRIIIGSLISCVMVLGGVVLASGQPTNKEQAVSDDKKAEITLVSTTGVTLNGNDEVVTLPQLPPVDPRLEPLAAYYETAMTSWITADKLSADYHSIAMDMAEVLLRESPIWDVDTSRSRTGVMLLAIGHHESGYRAYIDDGRCNKFAHDRNPPKDIRDLLRFGNCDGGYAHSLWQVHTFKWNNGDGHFIDFNAEALSDRKTAIQAALYIARRSIRGTGGLCGYSGEGVDGNGCPKAVIRYNEGQRYASHHPYTPPAMPVASLTTP